MLHTPNRNAGSSRYCGPCAMMAVTGQRGSDVSLAIREVRGHKPIRGLANKDLVASMKVLGWNVAEAWDSGCKRGEGKRPEGFKPLSFRDFLIEHGNDGPYIVNVTGHYMAVSHGEVCDAAATILPTDIERYLKRSKGGYRNAWVWKWWKFAK